MKSKRAQKELEKLEKFYPFSGWIAPSDTYRIAEIAERDAEDRMRAKAIKAHRACCPLNELQCIHRDRDDYTCTYDCRYVTSFIQKLSENEND